jgi:hypothetical protein
MTAAARWIRLGPVEALELHSAYAGLAAAQGSASLPILLWAQAKTALPLLHGGPDGAPVWAEALEHVFVLVAPRKFLPGRNDRWCSWALAPVAATYRQFGLRAYVEGDELRLHGRKVAGSAAAAIRECAVLASSFMPRFPLGRFALEEAFRQRLEAQYGWQFEHAWPDRAEREAIAQARNGLAELVGA